MAGNGKRKNPALSQIGRASKGDKPVEPKLQVSDAAAKKYLLTPFPAEEALTKVGKRASNVVNSGGTPMPMICTACLSTPASWKSYHTLGRGVTRHNEIVSCLGHAAHGNGGTQCGRCLGLSKGNDCAPPPEACWAEAKEVVAAIPAFNKVLHDYAADEDLEILEVDQAKIDKCVAASKAFVGVLQGLRGQGVAVSTPSTKRQKTLEGTYNEVSNMSTTLARDRQSTDEKLDNILKTVSAQAVILGKLHTELSDTKEVIVNLRARERHLSDTVAILVRHENLVGKWLNLPKADRGRYPKITRTEFDLATADMNDDGESESDVEVGNASRAAYRAQKAPEVPGVRADNDAPSDAGGSGAGGGS